LQHCIALEDGVVVGSGAKILGNVTVGKNCRIGAASAALRNVPDNSTVVGVPGHIIFREGKRVVIIDPKQINDPLSEAIASIANEVHKLSERRAAIRRRRSPYELLPESLQRRFSPTWSNMVRSERTSDLKHQNSDERPLEILQPEIECRGMRSVLPGGSPGEVDYPCCSSTSARSILFGR
jgi:hypothetical protein